MACQRRLAVSFLAAPRYAPGRVDGPVSLHPASYLPVDEPEADGLAIAMDRL